MSVHDRAMRFPGIWNCLVSEKLFNFTRIQIAQVQWKLLQRWQPCQKSSNQQLRPGGFAHTERQVPQTLQLLPLRHALQQSRRHIAAIFDDDSFGLSECQQLIQRPIFEPSITGQSVLVMFVKRWHGVRGVQVGVVEDSLMPWIQVHTVAILWPAEDQLIVHFVRKVRCYWDRVRMSRDNNLYTAR